MSCALVGNYRRGRSLYHQTHCDGEANDSRVEPGLIEVQQLEDVDASAALCPPPPPATPPTPTQRRSVRFGNDDVHVFSHTMSVEDWLCGAAGLSESWPISAASRAQLRSWLLRSLVWLHGEGKSPPLTYGDVVRWRQAEPSELAVAANTICDGLRIPGGGFDVPDVRLLAALVPPTAVFERHASTYRCKACMAWSDLWCATCGYCGSAGCAGHGEDGCACLTPAVPQACEAVALIG